MQPIRVAPTAVIVGRDPDDDDDDTARATRIARNGEVVRVPAHLMDSRATATTGGPTMADGESLEYRLRFASPEVRMALGLPAYHVEDGRGRVAGHAPGHAYPAAPSGSSNHRDAARAAHQRAADAAYAKRSAWLSDAWRNAK